MNKLLGLILVLFSATSWNTIAESYGYFTGNIITQWLPDGRAMVLIQSFQYTDPSGQIWDAPAGSIIDGASIPHWAWSIIGGPFEGKYRNASVIHDVACDRKNRLWTDTHLAFYTAMLASGVNIIKAKIMYKAVYYYGPRWALNITLKKTTDAELKSCLDNLKVIVGPHNDVIISDPGERKLVKSFRVPDSIHNVKIEISPHVQQLDESAFNNLSELIKKDNLSVDQIENYNPSIPYR